VNDYRPYPNYQQVDVPSHTNWANYNALQVSLNKQRGSLVFGVNYTWSKAMGCAEITTPAISPTQ